MKKFLKRIIRAIDAFNGEEPQPIKVPDLMPLANAIKILNTTLDGVGQVIREARSRVEDVSVIPRQRSQDAEIMDLWNKAANRNAVSIAGLKEQDQLIEKYFERVVSKILSPMLYSLYREDKHKIPNLDTDIAFFVDMAGRGFGKRVRTNFKGQPIGDATFMTIVHDDHVHQEVTEHIKSEDPK
mgnify:CR=1 FL=1